MGVVQEVLPLEVIPEIYAYSRFDIRIVIEPIWELSLVRSGSFVFVPVSLPLQARLQHLPGHRIGYLLDFCQARG
jgi:hypothetical protein